MKSVVLGSIGSHFQPYKTNSRTLLNMQKCCFGHSQSIRRNQELTNVFSGPIIIEE
jgi:hypothetical protein